MTGKFILNICKFIYPDLSAEITGNHHRLFNVYFYVVFKYNSKYFFTITISD